jgi:hypothetical protein
VALGRIRESENEIKKLQDKCAMLTYDDMELRKDFVAADEKLNKMLLDANQFMKEMKSDHEKRFAQFFSNIQLNTESIRKINKQIEENKHFQDMIITKTESISSRLSKTKENFLDELKASKNELTLKIEETDKFFNE